MPEIQIVAYTPVWRQRFETERIALLEALGDLIVDIQHVGSTAVPDLAAKPVIDILITANTVIDIGFFIDPLMELGYRYNGQPGDPGRHFFRKPATGFERDFHLHCMLRNHPDYEAMLLFRNYLRLYPETAAHYARLKRELAARYGRDRSAYTYGKTSFVRTIVRQARAEKIRIN